MALALLCFCGQARATPTTVNDASGSITYSGSWTYDNTGASGYINSDQHYSSTNGDYAQYTFTGTSIQWIGPKNVDCGISQVYIDGVLMTTVDMYAPTWLKQQVLYTNNSLTNASHTIKIVVTNTKNPSGSGHYSSIDAFIYDTVSPITIVNDASGSITYSGSWTYDNTGASGYINSDQHYSSTNGNYAQYTFTGTSIQWIGPKNVDCGISQVYIDGVLMTTVDMYAPAWLKQQVLYTNTSLTNASHTIKIAVTNTKNPSGTGYYSSVDAFIYQTVSPLTVVNDTSGSITYVGAWSYDGSGGAINSDQHLSSTPGDYAQFTFTGTAIQWIGARNISCGIINVYIDSVNVASVDTYSATFRKGEVLYSNSSLTNASHTIKLVVTNTANPADNTSPYYTISVDAFVYGTPVVPTWSLNTSDTNLTLALVGNQEVITYLTDPAELWNWTPNTAVAPLTNQVNGSWINWVYQDTTVSSANGTQVTMRYVSASPSLRLTSIWTALPGVGPVEHTVTLSNNTGSSVTINDVDVLAADLTVSSNNTVTVWTFNRSSAGSYGYDPGFTTGVFKQALGASTNVASVVGNDISPGSYVLPFEMLDTGAVHGAYIGYECDFGLFSASTAGNADVIRNAFMLMNSGSFTVAASAAINLPGMFYGTYQGNTEVGSNHMKKWFWTNKMTPSIITTTNEPLVETCINGDSASEISSFFIDNPSLASWGLELGKEDQGWTNDTNTDPPFGWDWSPNTAFWPNGINLGTLVHNQGMLLSLYMGNQYNHVDLATAGGVSSEQQALEARYNGTATNFVGPGFDYWRSDENLENTNDYKSHLGFVAVLDYMIYNHSNFRWENCSSGGSKKSFDLLQRQTFMTTEDSGIGTMSAEYYRMAYYANSYMINPVQLKADNGNFSPNTDTFFKYIFRCGFLGAWMWLPDFYTFEQIPEYIAHISLYKTHQRPILRGADVYHVLPICNGTNWDGIEFFNSTLNKGSVVLFKPNAGVGNSPAIVLQGLVATNTYSLTFQDRSTLNSSYTSVSGSTLMTTGISAISGTTGDYDSEIIWINY